MQAVIPFRSCDCGFNAQEGLIGPGATIRLSSPESTKFQVLSDTETELVFQKPHGMMSGTQLGLGSWGPWV